MLEQAHTADLMAGFGSYKFIPMPIVISTNNANPLLVLYNDHIKYRGGFTSNELAYANIEKIDVFLFRERTSNIVISKKTGSATFIGNFRDKEQLKEFLRTFQSKGCLLTEKAKDLIEK